MKTAFRLTATVLAGVIFLTATVPVSAGRRGGSMDPSVSGEFTKREWGRMKQKWQKEKQKWAACNKQAKDQKLAGRKSWSLIAHCMKS